VAFAIGPECIDKMDQSCVAVCPADCITNEPGVDRKLYIDPDECIECGSCYSACPNQAVWQSDWPRAGFDVFVQVDATWYRDRAKARQVLASVVGERAA
jgi:NAD-dependent dihydropyrimidine dehydrogenase PreA subunit